MLGKFNIINIHVPPSLEPQEASWTLVKFPFKHKDFYFYHMNKPDPTLQ